MTIIRPNSIAGITSVTASGGDITYYKSDGTRGNQFTHNVSSTGVITATSFSGGTGTFSSNVTISGNLGVAGTITYEDVARVDATGISTFREGFGVGPLAGIALTAYKDGSIRTSGIVTASSFVGDGSGLTGAGPSLANGVDNRVVTSSSATALNGEANLTFDGSTLAVTGDISISDKIIHTGDTNTAIRFPTADTITAETSGSERFRIGSAGNVGVNTSDPRGQFVIQSTKNALVNANCADPHHYHLSLKNTDEQNTAIGLCFSHDSTVDRVGAAIIHKREGDGSVGDMRFYTSAASGTTSERLRISSAGYVTKPAHPTFCARWTSGNTFSGDILVLTKVDNNYLTWNNGGHYSTSTGKFTAPVAGFYYFEGQVMATGFSDGTNIQDLVRIDSSNGLISHPRQRRTYFRTSDDANGYYTNSAAGQTKLDAGDTVWFRRGGGGSFGMSNTNYTYFTGWLIG